MEEPYFLINSTVRTLKILEYLSKTKEASVSEVSSYLNVNKSTAHRFLASMKHVGFVDQNSENQKYKLSLKVFEIGNRVVEGLNLREIAKPVMHELSDLTGETVNLGIIDNYDVVYIEKVLSKNTLRQDCPIGGRDKIHATALGKAMIAFKPSEYVEKYVEKKGLIKVTERTITETEAFYTELRNIRKNGYSIDSEETMIGLSCIAAPIFNNENKAIAAISISSPTNRLGQRNIEMFKDEIIKASQIISSQMGAK
ncbi:MAG: IclR family transcriptional regulator [Tepidanaerobacteraceae bacterium]|jgi:IclR family KDG regulon transcriptional repressor